MYQCAEWFKKCYMVTVSTPSHLHAAGQITSMWYSNVTAFYLPVQHSLTAQNNKIHFLHYKLVCINATTCLCPLFLHISFQFVRFNFRLILFCQFLLLFVSTLIFLSVLSKKKQEDTWKYKGMDKDVRPAYVSMFNQPRVNVCGSTVFRRFCHHSFSCRPFASPCFVFRAEQSSRGSGQRLSLRSVITDQWKDPRGPMNHTHTEFSGSAAEVWERCYVRRLTTEVCVKFEETGRKAPPSPAEL